MPANPQDEAARNAGTLFAVIAMLGVSGGMLALVTFVLPQMMFLVLVVAGFGYLVLFHYLVWGFWMKRWIESRLPKEDVADLDGP